MLIIAQGFNWQAAGFLVSICALLISGGFFGWIIRARSALQTAEMDKRYATQQAVKDAVDAMRKEVTGARQAMRRDMSDIDKKLDRCEAQSSLAVRNADTALSEATETRQLLEHYHDRIVEDFAKPIDRIAGVLDDLSHNVSAQDATLRLLLSGNILPLRPGGDK